MVAKFSALLALTLVVLLTVSTAESAANNCGKGNGRGNALKPVAGCPPNSPGGAGVPGPIAGVGLPFLIAGMVAYRRRRKTESDDTE